MKLTDDWRQAWRWWSVRVSAIGAAFFAFLVAAPDQALAIWQALPPELQAMIPNAPQLGLYLLAAVTIARILRQAKLPTAVTSTATPLGLLAAAAAPWQVMARRRVARAIDAIVVHCTATPEGKPFGVADIRRWHRARGWSDIGYHFVVTLDGSIEVGRAIETPGAHVQGHNARSIGVCYVGGVARDGKTPRDTRTPAQKRALEQLLRELRLSHPAARILGHRDFPGVAKACPSFDARAEYAELGR